MSTSPYLLGIEGLRMKQFRFMKIEKGYIIGGKKTPCSSKTKVMAYVTREFFKMKINEGTIIIKEKENELP